MWESSREHHLGFWAVLGVTLWFVGAGRLQPRVRQEKAQAPAFSAHATVLFPGISSSSPDGKKKVGLQWVDLHASPQSAKLLLVSGGERLWAPTEGWLDGEILWSPDSQAFSWTASCCGANGQYGTEVFFVRGSQLVKVQLTPLVETTFGHPVKCGTPEPPNVAAIRWLVPSKQILVAAEIVNHSICDSPGTFKAYEIDLAGPRIVRTYDQLETKKLFLGDLGRELRLADDNCIRKPKSCWVNGNHK